MTIAVAMIVTFLATSFLSGRQTSTVVVNPVVISAGDDSSNAGNDLTDMFLASLMRTNVFNVIDARTGQQPDADFYLSSSVNYREEEVEVGVEEKERKYRSRSTKESAETVKTFRQQVSFLRIDISVADGSGKVHFTEVGELDETSTGTVGSAAAPVVDYLTGRLATYVDIVGLRSIAKSVEGSVVVIMDPTTAVVDKGSKAGLAAGDEMDVRRGNVITNAAGEVIFSRMESIGKAEVSEVQEEGALITVAASVELQAGDTVVRGVAEPSVADHLETADALYDAAFYLQAVREYLAALESDPDLSDVLFPLAVSQLKTGSHGAAYESFAGFLDAGQPVELAATHGHTFGSCRGTFTLTRESVSYRSPREDDPDHWFDVPLGAVVESRLRAARIPIDGRPIDENLVLRAPSAKQFKKKKDDSKNWTLKFDLRGENTEVARIVSRYILRSQDR